MLLFFGQNWKKVLFGQTYLQSETPTLRLEEVGLFNDLVEITNYACVKMDQFAVQRKPSLSMPIFFSSGHVCPLLKKPLRI